MIQFRSMRHGHGIGIGNYLNEGVRENNQPVLQKKMISLPFCLTELGYLVI